MTSPSVTGPPWLFATSVLWATIASAQDFGLDLTDDTDYRPSAAVVGVAITDTTLPPGTWDTLKLERIASGAQTAVDKSDAFSRVVYPADAFGLLGEAYSEAFTCEEPACWDSAAATLDVNVVLVGRLVRKDKKVVLQVVRFSRFTQEQEMVEVVADRSPKLFEKAALLAFEGLSRRATGVMGILKIDSETPGATATLGPHPLGALPLEKPIPPGQYQVTVQAPGFLEDELEVQLQAGQKAALESNLIAKMEAPSLEELPPPVETFDPEVAKPAGGPSVLTRPGLYVALAGMAAIAAGATLGAAAQSSESRAVDNDGDGSLDITRQEANAAHRNALLANVLMGVGGVSVAGGAAWFFLAPSPPASAGIRGAQLSLGVAGVFP